MSLLDRRLIAFMAIVDCGTVRQASTLINITQTGVTQRIRSLESDLGVSLFSRSRQGMNPTPEGHALYRFCKNVLDMEHTQLQDVTGGGVNSVRRITITGFTSVLKERIIPQVSAVAKNYSNLLFSFQMRDAFDSIELLRSGKADLAITDAKYVPPDFDFKELQPDKVFLVGAYKWRDRELREILENENVINIAPEDQVVFDYLEKFDLLKFWNGQRHYISNTDGLKILAENGLGFTALAEDSLKNYKKERKLVLLNDEKFVRFNNVIAWYPRSQMPGYLQDVIDACF